MSMNDEHGRKPADRRLWTIAALAATALAAGGYLALGERDAAVDALADDGETPILMAQATDDDADAAEDAADGGDELSVEERLAEAGYAIGDVVLGDPDAPVTVIEYISLTCPHCRAFHVDVYPDFKEQFIETGQVRYIARELYGSRLGLFASALARCGGPDQFPAFLDVIFQRQPDWATSETMEDLVGHLRSMGRLGGLSDERIDACLNDETYLRTLFETARDHLERDEVPATPYFLINGQAVRGAASLEELSAAIEAAQ